QEAVRDVVRRSATVREAGRIAAAAPEPATARRGRRRHAEIDAQQVGERPLRPARVEDERSEIEARRGRGRERGARRRAASPAPAKAAWPSRTISGSSAKLANCASSFGFERLQRSF